MHFKSSYPNTVWLRGKQQLKIVHLVLDSFGSTAQKPNLSSENVQQSSWVHQNLSIFTQMGPIEPETTEAFQNLMSLFKYSNDDFPDATTSK